MVLAGRRRPKQWGQSGGSQGSSGGHGDPGETTDPAWGDGLQGGLLRKGCPQKRIKEMCQLKKKRKVFQVGAQHKQRPDSEKVVSAMSPTFHSLR